MIEKDNKQDNEIYVLGSDAKEEVKRNISGKKWIIVVVSVFAVMILAGIIFFLLTKNREPEYYFEPEEKTEQQSISVPTDSVEILTEEGYIEVKEEDINDVPLYVYTPQNAMMTLSLGMPDKTDPSIVFAAMAADIRKDNQEIVGDFVLSGQQLSRGVAKKGFCAIIDNTISIGMGDETPLLEKSKENSGFFFRQYPLVHNGELIENKPKNKSVRRALAVRNERVMMVESKNAESFHDFSQALVDIGISDAIYLVGGNAYGWYYNKEHIRKEFGEERSDWPGNISYIIWKIK